MAAALANIAVGTQAAPASHREGSLIVCGIDPGREGCICLIDNLAGDPGRGIEFWDTPTLKTGDRSVYDLSSIRSFICCLTANDRNPRTHAFLEKVQPQPKTFGAGPNFHLGYSLGMWEAMLAAFEVPYTLVSPQAWKKSMMAGMGKEKDASRVRALQLCPSLGERLKLKKHHNRADAYLIACYGFQLLQFLGGK